MVVSFKLSKIGTRYMPRPARLAEENDEPSPAERDSKELDHMISEKLTGISDPSNNTASTIPEDLEVSFSLSIFRDGYLIGKPNELDTGRSGRSLHPYDRESRKLFSAIEDGWLPGDILDDIPSKYYNGSVICEVKDYRSLTAQGSTPTIQKVRLRMHLENVVKDINVISDDSWAYSDILEMESRIVKAMKPELCLDPSPKLDRLCTDPIPNKLDLGLGRKRRSQDGPELVVTTNNKSHGKKICIDRAMSEHHPTMQPQNVPSGTSSAPTHHDSSNLMQNNIPMSGGAHMYRQNSNVSQEAARVGLPPLSSQAANNSQQTMNYQGPSSFGQNLQGGYLDSVSGFNAPLAVKREMLESQMPGPDMKKMRQTIGMDDLSQQQHQLRASQMTGLNPQLQHYATVLNGPRIPNQDPSPTSGLSSLSGQHYINQGMRYGGGVAKEEQFNQDSNPASMNNLTGLQWQQNAGTRRKTINSPRVPQSPVSSKSGGELSSGGSMGGNQFGTAVGMANVNAMAQQKDVKMATNQNTSTGTASKRKSNSVQKTQQQTMSGVGSPVSVSNMVTPFNASSPSIGTVAPSMSTGSASTSEQLLERFTKIEAVTHKHQLNVKKNKVDNFPKKPDPFILPEILKHFTDTTDDLSETDRPMSQSLVGGSINAYKSRIMHFFRPDRSFNGAPNSKPHYQLMLFERPFDGTVGMHHGDVDSDSENPGSLDGPLTLPTTYYADLLAEQFSTLMEKDGYEKKEDQIRPLPIRMVAPPNLGALPFSSDNSVPETKPEICTNQQQNLPLPQPANNMALGGTVSSLPPSRLQPSGNNNNPSGLPTPQGYIPGPTNQMQARSQPVDQALLQQQQIQQQVQQQQIQQQNPQQSQMQLPQIQRSGPMLSPNPLSHMIGGAGNQMGANSKLQQLHMIQQHQQQHQQISRKMMMGPLGPTSMGMANNLAGLGATGLGNIVGMGNMSSIRGMAGMPTVGNINTNQINLSNLAGIRPGSMTPQQHAAMIKMRLAQQQQQQRIAGMYNAQGGLGGMNVGNSGGSNPMMSNTAGLAMMGHNINRTNMSQMQRTPTGLSPMGPPKMPGTFYMNNPQQQQLQIQQQQQMQQHPQQQMQQHPQQQMQQLPQQQVQQQMQQQMQQIGSPLQQGSVGSPQGGSQQSGMIMPQQQLQHQQINPQQLAAMSPQQMGAGAAPQVSNGNSNNNHNGGVGANLGGVMPPASPQLSSQTNVSVGSITSSPMEQFQGANKSGPGSI